MDETLAAIPIHLNLGIPKLEINDLYNTTATENYITSALTAHDYVLIDNAVRRISALEDTVRQIKTQMDSEIRRSREREYYLENCCKMLQASQNEMDFNSPKYTQIQEDLKWLRDRYDDIQRIFNFDSMIINGINSQK